MLDLGTDTRFQAFDPIEYRVQTITQIQLLTVSSAKSPYTGT